MLMHREEEPEEEKKEPSLGEVYRRTHELAERAAIDPEGFRDLYGNEVVDQDKEEVERLEKQFEEERKEHKERMGADEWWSSEKKRELAEVFEVIFYEHAEMSNWLGPDATVTKASRYDDLKNGVDSIVEFTSEEDESRAAHLALAVDVTTSRADEVIREKLERIKREIDAGTLTRVKYFKSGNLDIRGELQNVPRTVIAADAWKTVTELGTLFMKGENKKLAEHFIQHQITDELLLQFKVFGNYAREREREDVYKKYKRLQSIVSAIREAKEEGKKPKRVPYDEGYDALRQALAETFK